MDELEKLPPESARAVSLRRMLGNPMEVVLAAELLAAGQTPDPDRLLEQRMEHLGRTGTVAGAMVVGATVVGAIVGTGTVGGAIVGSGTVGGAIVGSGGVVLHTST